MSSPLLYFAYGSNMSSRRLEARVASPLARGAAYLDDMMLRFDKPGRDGTAKANLVSAAGTRAWGVVYEVDASALRELDRFEPGYERRPREVQLASARVEAEVYLFHGAAAVCAPPSLAYLAHVLEGAREHALPEAWIELIRRVGRG